MRIRSVTTFLPLKSNALVPDRIAAKLSTFNQEIRAALDHNGFTLQSLRCATNPFTDYLQGNHLESMIKKIQKIENQLTLAGFDYVSIGSLSADRLDTFSLIPEIISETETVFVTAQMVDVNKTTLSIQAIKEIASVIKKLSLLDENGFANLFFAALANVPPGIPFLPAAYQSSTVSGLNFSLAMESADLAYSVFSSEGNLIQAGDIYRSSVEKIAKKLQNIIEPIGEKFGVDFLGFDFTPAPFVATDCSVVGALEYLTGKPFGSVSSLSAAAFLLSQLDLATFKRAGFNGLMLPVLEDNILAARVAEGTVTIKDLLSYSTVCGTGLDTVPLPGDISETQLQALLLDVASLAVRLKKPLTARLMPIPGKKAGEMTCFDFPYFTNTRIMSPQSDGVSGLLDTTDDIDIIAR